MDQQISITQLLNNAVDETKKVGNLLDDVAENAANVLRDRLFDNPDSVPTKTLVDFLTKYQSNKIAEQANLKDIIVEVVKLQGVKAETTPVFQPPKDTRLMDLIQEGVKERNDVDRVSELLLQAQEITEEQS